MKKVLVTILAFVYLTSTVGASVRLDCCLKTFIQTGIVNSTQESQWLDDTNDNCKDDHKQARPGYDQKCTDGKIRVAKYVPPSINTNYPDYSFPTLATITKAYRVSTAPLKQAVIPLFILNCVHRI